MLLLCSTKKRDHSVVLGAWCGYTRTFGCLNASSVLCVAFACVFVYEWVLVLLLVFGLVG